MIQEFLGQTNFAGRDGFYWWIGQIETEKGSQQKGDDRYKVRIVGQHLKDCNAVAYDDLPWAIVMMPATAPRREGGTSFQSVEYKAGDWVIGFFLDGREGQQPVIMGSIGQQYKASDKHTGKEKPGEQCLAFTTFLDPDVNTSVATPAPQADAVKSGGVDGTNNPSGNKPDLNQPPNTSNETASKLLLGTKCCNNETNPGGEYFCVAVSDAKCESTENDQSKFELVLSELFANIQNNRGQFGTAMVGQYTGKLYDYIDIANGYVNKATRLASSIVARVKGEMFAYIKQGAKAVIDFLLTEEVVDESKPETFVGPYADAKEAVKPAKKRVGRLRGLTAWINDQLKNVNCSIEDLDAKLRAYLEELIFGALDSVFNGTRCYISELIGDLFDQISQWLEDIINTILGPLQQLLSIIASPLNILGAAIAEIFDLLGITCTGPDGSNCSSKEQQSNCSGPCGPQDDNNFLDDLIAAVEDGNLDYDTGSCSDALIPPEVSPTTATPVGGTPNPSTFTGPSGSTPVTLPDYPEDPILNPTPPTNDPLTTFPPDGVLTPSPLPSPTTSSPATVSPNSPAFNTLTTNSGPLIALGNGSLIFSGGSSNTQVVIGSGSTFIVDGDNLALKLKAGDETNTTFESTTPTTDSLTYSLSVDKKIVFEGQSITFTLVANGAKITDGTIFDYAMFGNITADDFFDKKTTGTMTMFSNVATKTITIADDALEEPSETVSFNVKQASRTTAFVIAASDTSTKKTDQVATSNTFVAPVLGTPEVCSDGRIMDIPILSRGDRYLTPPQIKIRGAGFGASAKAVLDSEGYLKQIRVLRSGSGYAPNRTRLNCVINRFAIVSPGSGYYREPMVYVDGESNVAKATIDNRGYVKEIEVVGKTKTYECTPSVQIFGGNGLGAKAIPIMECRNDELFREFQLEVAPSGVDEVIDCP